MGSSDSRPLNAKSTALDVVEYFAVESGKGQKFLEGKTAIVTVSEVTRRGTVSQLGAHDCVCL